MSKWKRLKKIMEDDRLFLDNWLTERGELSEYTKGRLATTIRVIELMNMFESED